MKLNIELIPKTAWGENLRKSLKQSEWDKIRKAVYAKQDLHCYICDVQCTSLDAHELWEFNEETHVQRLVDIIGVCKACHNTIHFGRAQKVGYEKEAVEQFLKVNDCSMFEFKEEVLKAKIDYQRRSKIPKWTLDLSFVESQGFYPKRG